MSYLLNSYGLKEKSSDKATRGHYQTGKKARREDELAVDKSSQLQISNSPKRRLCDQTSRHWKGETCSSPAGTDQVSPLQSGNILAQTMTQA
ncbi:hypothetical protein RRG08_015902 [Elysia crispata]|uniref:Uncharacterized protein n=1 Tax=Elysia crispata TaxID=231223 RepID=A0AAE1AMJ9_9GAST|nr:hypothetical protein RRG08_015902 [Elysia crispata]